MNMKLQRNQPCGCIVCMCDDDERCHGCGAKHCGTHPVGQIPNPMTEPIQEAVLIERGLYEQVVEGLRRIAEPDQEPFMTTTDAIRALSATLKMLNAGRDIAQRLLAQLTEKQS